MRQDAALWTCNNRQLLCSLSIFEDIENCLLHCSLYTVIRHVEDQKTLHSQSLVRFDIPLYPLHDSPASVIRRTHVLLKNLEHVHARPVPSEVTLHNHP